MVIPKKAGDNFKEIVEEGDTLQSDINDNYIITKNKDDKQNKKELQEVLDNHKWDDILTALKCMGLEYKKDASHNNVKGVVFGIKAINIAAPLLHLPPPSF
jgi:hypothetical protein